MKAYVYNEKDNLVLKDVNRPECEENSAVIKIEACSVCGTDFRTYTYGSEKIEPGTIIGHEVTGELVEVGDAVEGFKTGDRVNVVPAIGCGECYNCKKGYTNLCTNLETIGFQYNGGFAEYMEIPTKAFKMGNVIKINENIDEQLSAVAEPIACCINAQSFLDIKEGDNVAIFGAGFIGCMHAKLAKSKEANQIFIIELDENRIQQVLKLIDDVIIINPKKENTKEKINKLTDNEGPNVLITACSSGKAQQDAQEIAAERARISLFGGLPGESTGFINSNLVHYKELTICGVHASTPEQNRKSLKWISGVDFDLKDFLTVYSLSNIENAFEAIKNGEIMKAVIKPE
ncbi:MAG: alcohol dehydrogenase catalytic domain-containing protein [Halanaerobiales bacterium]|nr:alcohol dehydrogenase catalytic domain-containing protein [Halanaerobiales bacterium]